MACEQEQQVYDASTAAMETAFTAESDAITALDAAEAAVVDAEAALASAKTAEQEAEVAAIEATATADQAQQDNLVAYVALVDCRRNGSEPTPPPPEILTRSRRSARKC